MRTSRPEFIALSALHAVRRRLARALLVLVWFLVILSFLSPYVAEAAFPLLSQATQSLNREPSPSVRRKGWEAPPPEAAGRPAPKAPRALTSTWQGEGRHGEAVADGATLEQANEEYRAKFGGGPQLSPVDLVAKRFPNQARTQGYERFGGGRNVILAGPGYQTELEYNANGQVVSKVMSRGEKKYTQRYEWNARGELIALTTPNGGRWEYRYDASGRRIEKKAPTGEVWRYVWMGRDLLHTLKNDKLVETYLHEPGGGCPILRDDGQVHFILPDQNESPSEEVGLDGSVEYLYQKGTWGEGFKQRGETGGQPSLGQWYDAESGLHYNHFRYYDPETGRYLSPDPIELLGGVNLYAYVPDPLTQIDPWGLRPDTVTRYMSESEATAVHQNQGLVPIKTPMGAESNKAVWVNTGDANFNPSDQSFRAVMTVDQRGVDMLAGHQDIGRVGGRETGLPGGVVSKESNEPGARGIGRGLLDRFNQTITRIKIEKKKTIKKNGKTRDVWEEWKPKKECSPS